MTKKSANFSIIFNHAIQKQTLAHIHTLKNFKTFNVTKHTSYIFNFKRMRKGRMYCTKLTVTSL